MNALGEKEKGGEVAAQEQAKEFDKSSPPPPYLRKRRSSCGKAKGWDEKLSSFPYSMQMGIRWDASRSMGHTLLDEMAPGQTGCGLGMAHYYRTLGTRNKAYPHAGRSSPSQARPGRAQRWNLHQGETNGPPELIRRPKRTPSDGVEEPNGR